MTRKAHAMTFPQISFGQDLVAGVRSAVPVVIFWDQKKKKLGTPQEGSAGAQFVFFVFLSSGLKRFE